MKSDVVIIGGSLGGVAAALAAAEAGARVILTEENAWIGGQATSQAVSALDEYDQVETLPATQSYSAFRTAIRRVYQQAYQVPLLMPDGVPLNPGNGWVSRLCFEPRVGLKVLNEMLEPFIQQGRLQILLQHRPVSCAGDPTHIASVEVASLGRQQVILRGSYYLDATDLGDLLPLVGVPYNTGAEGREDTGEPHASPDGPHPERVQSFTFCFLVEFRPGENHIIKKPYGYTRFKQAQPYSLTITNHLGQPVEYPFFKATTEHPLPFWTYRRVFDASLLDPTGKSHDIALINWPSNDYRWGNLIDQSPQRKIAILDEARRLSLGFLYWLQTEAPRDDGRGYGYPELKLLPEAAGRRSGIAQAPYVRESRRIHGLRRIVEQDISVEYNAGKTQAAFPDSAGIGWYPIDVHACVGDERSFSAPTLPFQIPLGALIPVECNNLIAACKNISTTHLTNGAYRLHPVEWSVGEAAGALAAYCCQNNLSPQAVWSNGESLQHFQTILQKRGVALSWQPE